MGLHKWLAKGFVNLLVAEQESGKSLFAIWCIVRSFLLGDAWPDGTLPEHDPQCKVLWIEPVEAGHQMLLERIKRAWLTAIANHLSDADPFFTPKLDNPADIADLRETIRVHRPKLLVFDALSGGHDKRENSSDEMLQVVRPLADIARDFGIVVLLIHHVGKAIENGEINLRSIRGASGITQLCRTAMAIEKLDDQGWLRLRTDQKQRRAKARAGWRSHHAERAGVWRSPETQGARDANECGQALLAGRTGWRKTPRR